MDQAYLTSLRVLHVAGGAFWAGTAVYLAVFILPAVTALGPDGGKFMQQLVKTRNLPIVMMIIPIVTLLSGILLIWKVSGGMDKEWVASTHGTVLIAGALSAITGFGIGLSVNRPTVDRINAIGKDIAAKGGPPSPAQAEELNKLRGRMAAATKIMAWLLGLAVIAMAAAHYI